MAIGNIQCADILSYPLPIIGPTMVGHRKKFQNRSSQEAGKRYFEIIFCKYNKKVLYFKPVARPVFQGWQIALGESCNTKSEGLFHTLHYCNQIGNVCAGKD